MRQLKQKEQQLELERKLVQLATERELTLRGEHEKVISKRMLIQRRASQGYIDSSRQTAFNSSMPYSLTMRQHTTQRIKRKKVTVVTKRRQRDGSLSIEREHIYGKSLSEAFVHVKSTRSLDRLERVTRPTPKFKPIKVITDPYDMSS